jgi:hypothetical protein
MAYKQGINYVEAGAFTPSLNFNGGTTGITYSEQTGEYTRIGNIVFFTVRMALTSKGTDVGNAFISGFPISTGGSNAPQTVAHAFLTITAGQNNVIIDPTGTNWALYSTNLTNGALANVTDTLFFNTSIIRFTGQYFIS